MTVAMYYAAYQCNLVFYNSRHIRSQILVSHSGKQLSSCDSYRFQVNIDCLLAVATSKFRPNAFPKNQNFVIVSPSYKFPNLTIICEDYIICTPFVSCSSSLFATSSPLSKTLNVRTSRLPPARSKNQRSPPGPSPLPTLTPCKSILFFLYHLVFLPNLISPPLLTLHLTKTLFLHLAISLAQCGQ